MRWIAGFFGATLITVSARAQPADDREAKAERAEAEAQALAQNGDMLGAAAKFREAYALDPRPELLCNVGVAYHKAKDLPRAQLLLSQCLTRGTSLEPAFVDGVRGVLAAAEGKLREGEFTPLDIVVDPAGATVVVDAFGARDGFVGSRLVYVPFGPHTITVTMEGHVERSEPVNATSREQRAVRVTLERKPAEVGSGPGPIVRGPRPSRRVPIVTRIATGVLAVGGLGAYLVARKRASEANEATTEPDHDASERKARSWQKLAIGLGAAAGVAAVVSGYLWYRATRSSTRIEVAPAPTGDGAAVSVTARF